MKEEVRQPASLKEAYEAPTCEIIEMQQEGVLCGSNGGTHQGFDGSEDYNW